MIIEEDLVKKTPFIAKCNLCDLVFVSAPDRDMVVRHIAKFAEELGWLAPDGGEKTLICSACTYKEAEVNHG